MNKKRLNIQGVCVSVLCILTISFIFTSAVLAIEIDSITKMESGTTSSLCSVWGFGSDSVFVVGWGVILYYNGTNWTEMKKGTFGYLYGVWGSSENNVFAVGQDGNIFHYDGSNWSEMTSGTANHLESVWGSSENNVFAVGWKGTILHYNGETWNEMPSPATQMLSDIWGSSENDVFAVGYDGTIIHYDGESWSKITSITTSWLRAVWGSSGNDVHVFGMEGTLLYYDGSEWVKKTDFDTQDNTSDAWGNSEGDICTVGSGLIQHYNGKNWIEISRDIPVSMSGIWGNSESGMFAVGGRGTILHYFTVTESFNLFITPKSLDVPKTSGITTFSISSSATGKTDWTATGDGSWFSINPSSGESTGTITVTYDANHGGPRTGRISITAPLAVETATSDIIQSSAHFLPAWTGNPYNRMSFRVTGANINGEELSLDDEIGIFDEDICVGMAVVEDKISASNPLVIFASQDDGTGNGFTVGNPIRFRFWDSSENLVGNEKAGVTGTFKNTETGDAVSDVTFQSNTDYNVILEMGQHDIFLSKGWNIISSYIKPENPDMKNVLQPLTDSGQLVKVIAQSGTNDDGTVKDRSFIKVFDEWRNTIGDFENKEGYQIKVNADVTLPVIGSKAIVPVKIYLSEGWNHIGYPYSSLQDAMPIFNPLINADDDSRTMLIKVISESGRSIFNNLGQWDNGIVNLMPGEGYLIKVKKSANTSDEMIINYLSGSVSRRHSKQQISEDRNNDPVAVTHFTPIWTGNPYNRMNLLVLGINGYEIEAGDEIGIFDEDNCVGLGIVGNKISEQNILTISTSMDDNAGAKGFIRGHAIGFRLWDSSSQTEIQTITPIFLDMEKGEPVETPTFNGLDDHLVRLKVGINLRDAVSVLKVLAGMDVNIADSNADSDNNKKTELKDAVYILQIIAGMRD